ncbi:MAG: hypothetical protein NTV87_10555 [Ignavibacteriae bacterium]|nr:hypothetical protein [Ignavibacteriota bacterium]
MEQKDLKRIYKSRHDLYYKLLIIYLMFLIIYSFVRGSIAAGEFSIEYKDPIIYITFIFILYAMIALIINLIKGKELEFMHDRIIFRNRFGTREIIIGEIIGIGFSREMKKNYRNRSPIRKIKIKLKNRKRYLRIRLSEFYDEQKLINEFKTLSKKFHVNR